MHGYFDQDTGNQHIFVLHGLGGAGKTQISLKFIQQTSTRFSDIFLIDTSTQDTIDTGLKNIAVTKNAGTSQQDALKWLSNTPSQWLLFFDNADDPKINLNEYLPLAIIQAGAFIAKSGALNTYLALYTQNKARLLHEKPTQSHDNYAWTVYTTWQISFEQLSLPAATLLQLCSFLHHQGIYEGIFSGASSKRKVVGINREESSGLGISDTEESARSNSSAHSLTIVRNSSPRRSFVGGSVYAFQYKAKQVLKKKIRTAGVYNVWSEIKYLIEPRQNLGISGVDSACFKDRESIDVIQDAPLISGNIAEQLWCSYRNDIKRCIAATFDNVVQFLCLAGDETLWAMYMQPILPPV
ncbi:hypothetical protein B0H11DRAFT_1930631 [Mycena galericulata]|nr:hypothetical protein B0H11DRAFT_1930631 [Mycena galericulata]